MPAEEPDSPPRSSSDAMAEELAQCRIRCWAYRLLVERYAEVISQGERKTLPELRSLLNPQDKSVQAVRGLLLEDYALSVSKGIEGAGEAFLYSYEKHFPALAPRAFEFVRSLRSVNSELSVPFWLSLREVWELRAGDPFDKALFLCSLLLSLGSPNARVRVLELEGELKHPVVFVEFDNKSWLLDPSQRAPPQQGPLDKTLEYYRYGGKRALRSLYEFNHEGYQEFTPSPSEGG